MTIGQGVEVGPFSFTIIRILVAAGVVRIIIRGERLDGGLNSLDWLMLVWAAWALVSSGFHKDPSTALIFRLGLIYNSCGIYFLIRIFCQSLDDVKELILIIAILLVPVAIAMLYEKMALRNMFSVLGGVPEMPQIRMGSARASGPFRHPILAGTVGAVCLPLMIGLWHEHRKLAYAGIVASLSMVIASASSGPMASSAAGIGALFMWRYRDNMRLVRWIAVLGYIALDLVMKAPAYYLMGRVDLAGGSAGWHRAALIESAMKHLNEWWLAGTDFTRHWMPTGVSWSPDHTDITNHYLHLGVLGGLPLMLLFIASLAIAFSMVGKKMQHAADLSQESRFMFWTLGASLFTNAASMVSVSYFDQSFLFLYLTLAAIGSAYSSTITAPLDAGDPERTPGLIPG